MRIKDGKVLCHHWYWISHAFESQEFLSKRFSSLTKLPANWRELLKAGRESVTAKEMELLLSNAKMVAGVMDGFWSVDFCRAKDGTWYLIDMAVGEDSWHPRTCPHSK